MIRIYYFFYYCCYCLVLKRANDNSHVRALMFHGITISNFLTSLLFFFYYHFELKYKVTPKILFTLIFVYLFVALIENKIFLNTNYYLTIIEKYDNNRFSKWHKNIFGVLALLTFLLSFFIFMIVGYHVGQQ